MSSTDDDISDGSDGSASNDGIVELQGNPNHVGTVCEIRKFESYWNKNGERVVLKAGTKLVRAKVKPASITTKAALLSTRVWDRTQTEFYTELEVQSPHMKAALKAVVPKYKDIDPKAMNIVFRDTPQCVFHYRDELLGYRRICSDQTASQHVQYLLNYVDELLLDEISIYNRYVKNCSHLGKPGIDYINLWMVFVPGELLYEGEFGQIFKFHELTGCACLNRPNCEWTVSCYTIATNGVVLGHEKTEFTIKQWDGIRALDDLPVYPLRFCERRDEIRFAVLRRSKMFQSLIDSSEPNHRQYNNLALLFGYDREQTEDREIGRLPCRPSTVSETLWFIRTVY